MKKTATFLFKTAIMLLVVFGIIAFNWANIRYRINWHKPIIAELERNHAKFLVTRGQGIQEIECYFVHCVLAITFWSRSSFPSNDGSINVIKGHIYYDLDRILDPVREATPKAINFNCVEKTFRMSDVDTTEKDMYFVAFYNLQTVDKKPIKRLDSGYYKRFCLS